MKRLLILYILCLISVCAYANVSITAQAPDVVAVDEQFRLQFTVNSQSVTSVSNLPDIPGFEVLYGPSRSTSYSMQIINGKQSQNSSTTYSYVLMATKTGTYTLPKLTVVVGGQSYTSNAVQVKVLANSNASSSHSHSSSQPSVVKSPASTSISNKDLFIAVTANKNEVYEQEPVLLTYRVYSRVNLTELRGNMPDLKGFMVKEIPLPQQKSFSVDTFNGENYYTTVWSQYLMFPQQSGKLTIPKIKFDGVVVVSNPNIDLIDAFFNGTSSSVRQRKTIIAPSLDIKVKPLPEGPADFSGGVGSFTIKAKAKNATLKQNETLDIQVSISGSGNVDLIKAPKVEFPSDFDTYDPKMTNSTKLTSSNMNGSLVIDYLAVPKNKGHYTIPGIKLIYFDTQSRDYKTIQTGPIEVEVLKGEKNIYADKQREILAKSDIRFIKTGDVKLSQKADVFWNTPVYWLLYVVGLILLGMVLYVVNHRMSVKGDSILMRRQGANRLAIRRLKKAQQLQKKNQADAFYDEMLNALNGFVADKLNITISELSKERVAAELADANVSQELCDSYLRLLDNCEFMRYAGGADKNLQMDEIYHQGLNIISLLDAAIKRKK